jgi:peroxiredoxin
LNCKKNAFRMMRKNLFLVLVSAVLVSCSGPGGSGGREVILEGTLANAGDLTVFLEELTTTDLIPIDSIRADSEGNIYYRRTIEDAGFYILRVDDNNFVTLLVEPGEKVEFSGDADLLGRSFEVSGSPGSVLISLMNKRQWADYALVDSLNKLFRQKRYEPDFQEERQKLRQAYDDIFEQHQAFIKQFIEDNPESLASILALYQNFGNKLVIREHEHFDYFDRLSQSLSQAYPENKHVIDLKRRVSEHKRMESQRQMAEESLAIGSLAPDIVLPDPEGNQISLSSLKGNVVLIDFWAAWCPPCRRSNQELKKIYEKYQDRGFEIYAVSLDRTLSQWVLGIEEDGITWPQVSDLRFWSSPVVGLYNVEAIPHSVLIDQDMKIVAKGLTPRQLESKLSQMFGLTPTL